MADTNVVEDDSCDEGEDLIFRPRRQSKILRGNAIKLNLLIPTETVLSGTNEKELHLLRRHSSPVLGYNSPLPSRKDFFKKLEVDKGNGINDHEEGWKVKDDGSFCYEEDDWAKIAKDTPKYGHMYAEWRTKKNNKKGAHRYISEKVSKQFLSMHLKM